MKNLISKLVAVAAVCGAVASASAQTVYPIAFASFKWNQAWTAPRATFTSKVTACAQPAPAPAVAADDWLCTKPGPIIRIGWWGWLRTTAQAQRRYYVAIYPDVNCRPGTAPIYQACVTPDVVKLVGKDCDLIPGTNLTHDIYYLSAKLPAPYFQQTGTAAAPQHYWLQISEDDSASVQFGVEDFRWAGRRPLLVCPAVQFNSSFTFQQPILDRCDQIEDDLSFRLYSSTIIIVNPTGVGGTTLHASLLTPAGDVVESRDITTDPSGRCDVDFDAPDGSYLLDLSGAGTIHRRIPITKAEGVETTASFFDVFYGDLDNDGFCNTNDLVKLLGSFGQSAH